LIFLREKVALPFHGFLEWFVRRLKIKKSKAVSVLIFLFILQRA